MRVAYVVVAFRSAADLPGCLDSIATDAPAGSQIVVVDNASPDDGAVIAAAHPSAPLVVSSVQNLGFGGGCNLGASRARGDVLFFLNPDARLRSGATAKLLAELERDPGVGVVGPRVIDSGGGSRAASAGAEPTVRSALGHFLLLGHLPGVRRWFKPLHLVDPRHPTEADWVSGAAMLVRRSGFEAIGGFDERMFLYMEDVDLCRRAREAGWKVRYVPASIVDHRIGGSQSMEQSARWYRAFHTYVGAHSGMPAARIAALAAAIGLGARAVVYRAGNPVNSRRVRVAAAQALRSAFAESSRRRERVGAPRDTGASGRKRVLIISREAPPALGPHPIRVAKLAKYLPAHGWDPTILTVPLDHVWYLDDELMDDIGTTTVIRVPRLLAKAAHPRAGTVSDSRASGPTLTAIGARTRRLRSAVASMVLLPDPSILWALPAMWRASQIADRFDAVLTTGPPFSTHIAGEYLARRCRRPWVAEYRDNWTVNPLYRRSLVPQWANEQLERSVLEQADAVVVVSEAARNELATAYPAARSRVKVAPNGFDPDDIPSSSGRPTRFEIVHMGTLDRRRDPRSFFAALGQLAREDASFAALCHLRLMGNAPGWVAEEAREQLGVERVSVEGLVPHRVALEYAGRAALLVGLTTRAEAGESALTSKLFEYLGLRRPVLMLAPDGPAREIVIRHGAGFAADPEDVGAIVGVLAAAFEEWRTGQERTMSEVELARFTRQETARLVAEALDAAVECGRSA